MTTAPIDRFATDAHTRVVVQDELRRALDAAQQFVNTACVKAAADFAPWIEARARIEAAHAALATAHEQERARDRQALECQIAELQREVIARDEMLSVIGHELRNPISPLFLLVGSLLSSARSARTAGGQIDAAWLASRLEALDQRIQRFLAVLDRILDVSQLGAGRIELRLEPVDLSAVVHDIAQRYERDASSARCDLRVTTAPAVVGMWDRLRLEQIVSNLLSNAIRYGAGNPIELGVTTDADSAQVTVRDGGIGIAESDQTRIFRRFERAQHAGSAVRVPPRTGGFGVGLWVVKNLCDAFGGSISVDSAPDAGATFTVTLPRGTNTDP